MTLLDGLGTITDCEFHIAFRERRRLPQWLHRRLLRLVVEPTYPLVLVPKSMEPSDD
jgi:hypothetical protein